MQLNPYRLSQIWWLVSSQNPFKKKNRQEETVMRRLKEIKDKNKNYKVIPMALRTTLNTKYSYDTINILKKGSSGKLFLDYRC